MFYFSISGAHFPTSLFSEQSLVCLASKTFSFPNHFKDIGSIVMLQEYKLVLFCRLLSTSFVIVFPKCASKHNATLS